MGFKVKARVLLELGAELISSDGVAFYELIKNAVDAGSQSIEVRFEVALLASGFRAIDQQLQQMQNKRLDEAFAAQAIKLYFEPSASNESRSAFSRQFIGLSPAVARSELRSFFRKYTYVEVEDWGCGMSAKDLEEIYLTVGTPNRANQRKKPSTSNKKILGEKGIGRLSAMRLGNYLEVITAPVGTKRWASLDIDWSSLDDLDMDIEGFLVKPEQGGEKEDFADSGTLIRISDLRGDWSLFRVSEIARKELSKLQDPFDTESDVLDLSVAFNGSSVSMIEDLDRRWLDTWHGYFEVSFGYVDDPDSATSRPVLAGKVAYRIPNSSGEPSGSDEVEEHSIRADGDGLFSLLADAAYPMAKDGEQTATARFDGIATLGPFSARGYWFNRQRSKHELGDSYEEFKHWLVQWAGGLLMYRDGFRVYPYADPEDDWLELDQRALRQRSFKLNRGQFVGFVRISSDDNPRLRDQTNRQGLCDSPEKRALIQCLQHVIWKELGTVVTRHAQKSVAVSLSTVRDIEKQVKERSRDAKGKLRELARRVPGERDTVNELRSYVEELELAWSKAKAALKRQASQTEIYVHLAGVGMLLEFVVHELTRVTNSTLSDLRGVREAALPPGLRSLSRQLQTLEKRLRILDPISTPGRQRKEQANIVEIVETLIDAHELQFERHQIECELNVSEEGGDLLTNVVAGQMYQIFENLISNSVYWLTHHRAMKAGASSSSGVFKARISIDVDVNRRTVSFKDNGPGIEVADRDKIFEPFFSKKPAGRGIGLFIVRSLCKENEIDISLLPIDRNRTSPGFLFAFS